MKALRTETETQQRIPLVGPALTSAVKGSGACRDPASKLCGPSQHVLLSLLQVWATQLSDFPATKRRHPHLFIMKGEHMAWGLHRELPAGTGTSGRPWAILSFTLALPLGNNGRSIEVGQARAPPAPLAFSGPGVSQEPPPAGPRAQ